MAFIVGRLMLECFLGKGGDTPVGDGADVPAFRYNERASGFGNPVKREMVLVKLSMNWTRALNAKLLEGEGIRTPLPRRDCRGGPAKISAIDGKGIY